MGGGGAADKYAREKGIEREKISDRGDAGGRLCVYNSVYAAVASVLDGFGLTMERQKR